MKRIDPNIRQMTYQEAAKARQYSRGLLLEYEGRTYRLNAGTSDQINVFTRSIYLFVLIINNQLDYIGLDAYAPMEDEPINSIYLHSEHHIRELLGNNWKRMNPETVTTKLLEYLM